MYQSELDHGSKMNNLSQVVEKEADKILAWPRIKPWTLPWPDVQLCNTLSIELTKPTGEQAIHIFIRSLKYDLRCIVFQFNV